MIRVLYIDDEPDLLDIARLFLEATGDFLLETKISGQEGLDALKAGQYDAVVSDYQMPGMDGIAFLKAVRSGSGSIPFILFTGRGREEVVIEAINSGADFYLQKGGDPRAQFAELAHKIRQAVARHTAERSRIESEKRLSDIINFLPDATFAIDTAGTVIAWNHAIEEMTGIPASAMTGKGNYEYAVAFYGERRPILIDLVFSPPEAIRQNYSHIVQDGTMLAAETALPRVKGEPRTLWGKAVPLYDQNGQVNGAIESIRDITERKKSEQKLAEQYRLLTESESRLRRAEVVARIGHWGFHLDTGMMTGSENAAAIYGVKSFELPIIAIQKIPLPEYRKAMDDALSGLIKRGEPYNIDFRIRRPGDGALRDIHSVATYDPEKRTVFGIIQDITERKKIETELAAANEQLAAADEELRGQYDSLAANQKALAASEEKYRAILDNIQDVYYRTDAKGTLVMISPSGASLLGYAGADMMTGRPARDFYADPAQRDELIAVLKKDGAVSNRETILKRKDGSLVTVSTSSHVYYDAEGTYAGVEGIFRDITELKRAEGELRAAYEQLTAADEELRGQYEELARGEQELRENQENFRNLVESAPDAIYISVGERFAYVNPAMVRLVGASSAEDLIGMPLYDRVAPQCRESIHDRARVVIGERRPVGLQETVYLKMDGTPVPVESSVALFRYQDHFAGLVILRDITGHKKAEQALLESEQKYRALVEATGTGFVILDGNGKVLDANEAYVHLTGHASLLEIVGRSVTEWTAEYDLERNAEAVRQCLAAGFIHNLEIDYTDSSGRITPVEINASVISSGDTVRIFTLCRDISGLRRSFAALRESEKKYRDMFEINNAVMFIVDPDTGQIMDANAAACRYYGYSRDEFLRLTVAAINVQDLSVTQKDMAHALVDQGAVFHFRHKKKGGEIRDVEVFSAPITQNGHRYLHSIVQDVTDRRLAEEAMKLANRKLNLLSAITRHDIGNQLTALFQYIDLSKMMAQDPGIKGLTEKEEAIARNIRRQIEFTRDYEQLGAGTPAWQDVKDCVERGILGLDLAAKKVETAGIGPVAIFADPLLQKVFFNLVDNALRHGGDKLTTIRFSSQKSGTGLLIICEDDGEGIPAGQKELVFERGFGKNTGFGLFFIREILGITGITIQETGEPGRGARFEMFVPEGVFRESTAP